MSIPISEKRCLGKSLLTIAKGIIGSSMGQKVSISDFDRVTSSSIELDYQFPLQSGISQEGLLRLHESFFASASLFYA